MRLGDPDRVAKTHEIALWLLIVCAVVGGINGALALADRAFPNVGAESIPAGRIVLCGRMGKYRVYCGIPNDFVGPVENPVAQWNRKP